MSLMQRIFYFARNPHISPTRWRWSLGLLLLICPTIWAAEHKKQQDVQQDAKLQREAKLRAIVETQMNSDRPAAFRLAAKYGLVDCMRTVSADDPYNMFMYDRADKNGKTALRIAIENGQQAVVQYLLDLYERYIILRSANDKMVMYSYCLRMLQTCKKADLHKESIDLLEQFVDTQALRFAIDDEDIPRLEELHEKNPDLIKKARIKRFGCYTHGLTAICYADYQGSMSAVYWLAKHDAPIGELGPNETLLFNAVQTQQITARDKSELIKLLCTLEQSHKNSGGRKPLLLLYLQRNDPDPDIVHLLLKHGADPNYVCSSGDCPLFRANDECAKILCDHGATIDAQETEGNCNTMLMNVCVNQFVYAPFRLKKVLKDFRPDITIKNKHGLDARTIAQIYNPGLVFALDHYAQSAQGKPVTRGQAAEQRKAEIAALAKKADDQGFCTRYQRPHDFYHKRFSLLDNPDSLLSRAYDRLDDGMEFERLLHLSIDEYEQEEKKAQEPERLAKEKEDKARKERQVREQAERKAKETADRKAKEKAEHEAKVKADKETQRVLKRLEKEELAYRERIRKEREARERPMVGERVPDGIAQFVKQNLAQQAKKQEELAEEQEQDLVAPHERVLLQERRKQEKAERREQKLRSEVAATMNAMLANIQQEADRQEQAERVRKEQERKIQEAQEQANRERQQKETELKQQQEREYKERSAKVRSEGGRSSLLLDKCSSLKDAVDTYCWQQAQEGNLVKLEDVPAITKQIARTWIFEAIARGDLDGVKNCIEQYNVDINARDTLGRRKGTPLHVAVNAQQPAIVEYLLGRDADFRMMDAHQKTAGFWAEELLRESPSKLSARVLECFKANVLSDHHIKRVIKEVSDKWVSSSVPQKKTEDAPGMLPLVAALASSSLAPMPTVRGVMSAADLERRLIDRDLRR